MSSLVSSSNIRPSSAPLPSSNNPPSPIGTNHSVGDDMDETISLNTTMLTDGFNDDLVLDGESIIDSIRRSQQYDASSLTGPLFGRSFGPNATVNEPTIFSEESKLEAEDEPTIEPTLNGDASMFAEPLAAVNKSSTSVHGNEAESAILKPENGSGIDSDLGGPLEASHVLDDTEKKRGTSASTQPAPDAPLHSEKMFAQLIRIDQVNAAQTPFTTQPAVLSYSKSDVDWATKVKASFKMLVFKDEVIEDGEIAFSPSEFRVCLLSESYAKATGEAKIASKAAELNHLVILKLVNLDDGDGAVSEEWESLCMQEYCFPATSDDEFQKAIISAERFVIERISLESDEYTAVTQIDEYDVIEELGHGAQGIVYKAQHGKTKDVVAIKEMRNMAGKVSSNAKSEIAIMKRLDHPNVAKLIKVFQPRPEDSTSLFLVMEYVPGGSLMTDSQVWRGDALPISAERTQVIFQQIVKGISYLHHMGVLHRDIKPSNILGNREHGNVKVCDFGVSSFTKEQKSARVLGEDDIIGVGSCGTPAFLPPEASGAGFDVMYHGRIADVWSLGVTLYVLLSGYLPFKGQDRVTTAAAICNQKLKIPSHIPALARELLQKILEKDPAKRATLAWVANHPWVNAGNWSETDFKLPEVSAQEVERSLSRPQSLRKTIRKRSQSFVKFSGSILSAMLPSPGVLIRSMVAGTADAGASPGSPAATNGSQSASSMAGESDFSQKLREWFCCTGERDKCVPKEL